MSSQPVLQGAEPQIRPLRPSGGSERYTSAPVPALAWRPTSGTPRMAPIAVLPAGGLSWYPGRLNTSLNPPPETVQPTSATRGKAGHLAGGSVLSTTRLVVLLGSVHRYVPPTPVTSGSEAGHSTVGYGMSVPPLLTGDLRTLAVPLSPDEPRTVTPFSAADFKADRRLSRDLAVPNASSAEAKDCQLTVARRWSMTYCSAGLIFSD